MEDKPTLKEAVDQWLFRTPIHGSGPDDQGDRSVVDHFVESYLQIHESTQRELAAHAISISGTASDEDRLMGRYEADIGSAKKFLRAQDEPEGEERFRRQRIRAALLFIETYRELPLLAWPREVVDGIVAVEQAFVVYRQRHARMVERMIGRRVGTGGSKGVDYLDEGALRYRIFGDMWAARTLLVRRDHLPDAQNPDFYEFRFDGRSSTTPRKHSATSPAL
jgi:tryptophan 2,3-dioxygenase